MTPARRLVTLLAVASLVAGVVPAAASAQDDNGAGDQQYQDPFGSSQTSTPAKKKSATQAQGKKNGLSQTPNLGSSGTAGASSSGSSGAGSLELARTGGAPGPLALIGVALLLGGIGLRLRTADEPD